MSKPVRVPREVQRAAWVSMWEMLRQSRDDALGIVEDLHERFGADDDVDGRVAEAAWRRTCDSLITIAKKRGGVE